jgi:hypothetical protein
MNHLERRVAIAARKERLIARAAAERAAIARALRAWEAPLGAVDRAVSAVRYLRAHPLALAALAAGVLVLGRRNLVGWAARGLTLWRLWRALSARSNRLFV